MLRSFSPLFLLLAALLAHGIGSFSGDEGRSGPRACQFSETIAPVDDYERLITFADPYLGNFEAGVTVIEYFDPNCIHCKSLHPVMKEVIEANSKRARFFFVPFVLWQHSLLQIEALFVAGQDGKYFEMLDRQFELQKPEGMNVEELVAIASEIGLDPVVFRTRLEKGLNLRSIVNRRTEISDIGITGTPAVMINGKVVDSQSRSLSCLNELIAQEAG